MKPIKFNEAKRVKFLRSLVESGGNVSKASRDAGISVSTVNDTRRGDERFSQAMEEAVERGVELLESEAIRRAFQGVEEPVYYKGEISGYVTKYSDAVLMFLLRGKKRTVYGDQRDINLQSKVDLKHEISPAIQEALDEIYKS